MSRSSDGLEGICTPIVVLFFEILWAYDGLEGIHYGAEEYCRQES